MSKPYETLEERLANRRRPGDRDYDAFYDAFYDATDADLAAMVPPRPPVRPPPDFPIPIEDDTEEEYRRDQIREAATMLGCPYYRGEGKCASGCYSEPSCITDEPAGDGWVGVLIVAEWQEPGSIQAALCDPDLHQETTP